ncbi:MAG TPA: hypothetical protein VL475_07400 [Planctomycetaceae bacterium]|nr:hypothetical protein [Planctomycetaceae bacterium]
MNGFRRLAGMGMLLAALAVLAAYPVAIEACPFCSAPTLTLTEQFTKADAAVLVQWVGGELPKEDRPGNTVYEILQVARAPFKSLEKGKKITLDRYRTGKKGDLALLLGSRAKEEVIEWGSPLDVTEASYNYIVKAPGPDTAPDKRLAYYIPYLEFSDAIVSADAYAEFANAPYKDIVPLAKEMPREKLQKWIASPDIPATRLGLYGLMLGLCGHPEDAPLMERKIVESTEDFRLGIDGVIGGYLLLTGERGLAVVEKSKLLDKKVPFSETYAAMQALRFMWTYGNGRIPADRLKVSMRLLLDRPELADLVIADLARWKDWSLQPRLIEIYGTEEYNVPSIKRAIIRYMIASTKDVAAGAGEPPKHAADGTRYLQQLREKDPKMVSEAERFFFLN